MSDEITYVALADIVKKDKNADGSITITGVISSPKVDLDRQVMDPEFLKRAATDWFTQRANIREMHQPLAIGKGKELVTDPNGFLVLTSKIVEPGAVKKVEEGVLSGYSVGIKNARVVRDTTAPNGRIVDGTMVECSLVDYPSADVGKVTIAKAAAPDEDTGAHALTADELAVVDAGLLKAAEMSDEQKRSEIQAAVSASKGGKDYSGPWIVATYDGFVIVNNPDGSFAKVNYALDADGNVSLGASAPVEQTWTPKVADNPATGANLTPDALRAKALEINPTATEADLNALVTVWRQITSPNQNSNPIPTETKDQKPNDPDAGASASRTTDAAASAGGDESSATTPQKLNAQDLAGSVKAALPDLIKAPEFTALVADMAKAALADSVKAAVEEATRGLDGRLAKLEKMPAPVGPYIGPEKVLRVNETFASDTGKVAAQAPDSPVRARLAEWAAGADPTMRRAALEALAAMAETT